MGPSLLVEKGNCCEGCSTGGKSLKPGRKKLRIPIKIVLVGLFLCVFGSCFYFAVYHHDYAENVASVRWLPKSATNISYYQSYSYFAYEFDISEENFLLWAGKQWEVSRIAQDEPFVIRRYSLLLTPYHSQKDYEEYESETRAKIKEGWGWKSEARRGGGGARVAYDSTTGRAYYEFGR